MNVLDLIRNEPRYPWEHTPRREVLNAVNAPYRAMCVLRAAGMTLEALADVVGPRYGDSRQSIREIVEQNVKTIRAYLVMAAKG